MQNMNTRPTAMPKTLVVLLAVLAFAVSAAAQPNFKIKGVKLPSGTKNGTTVKLLNHHTWDSVGSATVRRGKFVIEGHTDTVFMGWLTDSRHFHSPVVVEPGMSVKLNARANSLSGSPLNAQLNRHTRGLDYYVDLRWSSEDIKAYAKEGGWLYRLAKKTIARCCDSIRRYNEAIGWQVYHDNADNVVGAWVMSHYFDVLLGGDYYYSDTVSPLRHKVDSLYAVASPVVRNFRRNRNYYEQSRRQMDVAKGNRFIDFSAIDRATNDTVLLSQLIDGHVAVVDFWASWCGPCRHEITHYLKPLHEKYADQGLVIVGVGVFDGTEQFDQAISQLEIPYPQIIDTTYRTVANLYGVSAIPEVFVIDRNGNMLGSFRGEELVEVVEKTLGVKKD